MINMNKFCPEDLQMFIECSNFIEQSRSAKRRSIGSNGVMVQKLSEEYFDLDDRNNNCAEIVIDENFDVNNLSLSMKNLFQYFNEDVKILSGRESFSSVKHASNRDLHRPVIVDASPKVTHPVRFRSRCADTTDSGAKKYLKKNRISNMRNSLPAEDMTPKSSDPPCVPRRLSLEIAPDVDDDDHEGFPAHTQNPPGRVLDLNVSVKDRVAFFNTLTKPKEETTKKSTTSSPQKLEISTREPVAVIKTKLYQSMSDSGYCTCSEEPVLPAESVRSQIEKFERGELRSPYQSRSSSNATLRRDPANSSNERLTSPTLVKRVGNFFHYKRIDYRRPPPTVRSSDSFDESDSDTLDASSPRPISSPSDYWSSSDDPAAVERRRRRIPFYSPSSSPPNSITPDSMSSEASSTHPFIRNAEDLRRLQEIVNKIREIRAQGFIGASQDLFEQFLSMLCTCADICLLESIESCNGDLEEMCSFLEPPENELQKSHDNSAALSEHQLRVQASLQRLNIPDWFRQYNSTPKTDPAGGYKLSNFNRKRASESGRWTGLNSKTTSLSSLGSQRSDRSPLMLSPSANSHHGGQTGFSRWSTSHLNSTQTSPSVSTRGSFSRGAPVNSSFISGHSVSGVRNSFRQPYLGWRSQEKLALSQPRTPHERLASSVLAQHHQHRVDQEQLGHQQTHAQQEPPVTPEIQSSIKEVTSAIVHYVNDQTNRTASRSRSTSPSSRKCWVESSFVGIKPVESPQTPVIENNSFSAQTSTTAGGVVNKSGAILSTQLMNGVVSADCSSPNTASLEDVLTSLLGLPSDSTTTGDTVRECSPGYRRASASPSSLQVEQQSRLRRRSEGDAQKQQQLKQQQQLEQQQQQKPTNSPNPQNDMLAVTSPRRISLDSSDSKTASDAMVRCRNNKCDKMTSASEAKRLYKTCHNCPHQYCSRECRRAHWEKHRKACLHTRSSNLCKQVLSSCKDDMDTLRHLSLLARKGYLSQGRGVVRILFRSPERAEAFIKNGFQCLGEASYVRWPDLMPSEMGLELYSELLRLSTEYKPESKMLIFVAICVVSEAPASGTAAVKWERQLVSRCAKLKLCKAILNDMDPALQQNAAAAAAAPQEAFTEILILTFNNQKVRTQKEREIISVNIQTLLSRRGVSLRKHYPEIYQRLQNYVEAITDKFAPVTIHPRDSQTGQGFVCIIMPNAGDIEPNRLPKLDKGNRVSTFDVGEELFES